MVKATDKEGLTLGDIRKLIKDCDNEGIPDSTPILIGAEHELGDLIPVQQILGDINSINFYDYYI